LGRLRTSAQSTGSRIDKITAAKEATTTSVSADPQVSVPLTPLKDAADFNKTFNWFDGTKTLPTHILDLVDAWKADPPATMRGLPVLPQGDNEPGTVRWQLDSGVMQDVSDGVITYTFATWKHGVGVSNNPLKFGQGQGYSPFTAAQIDAGRIAIENWDDLIAAEFVEVPAGTGAKVYGQNTADIVFSNT